MVYYKLLVNDNMDLDSIKIAAIKGASPHYRYEIKNTKKREEIINHIKELIEININEGEMQFRTLFLLEFTEDYNKHNFFNGLKQIWDYTREKAIKINPNNN